MKNPFHRLNTASLKKHWTAFTADVRQHAAPLLQHPCILRLRAFKAEFDRRAAVPAWKRSDSRTLQLYRLELYLLPGLLGCGLICSAGAFYLCFGLTALCTAALYPHVCKLKAEQAFLQAEKGPRFLSILELLSCFNGGQKLPEPAADKDADRLPCAWWESQEGTALLTAMRDQVYLGTGFAWQGEHLNAYLQTYITRQRSSFTDYPRSQVIRALGRDRLQPLFLSASEITTHALIFGTTGSGKSTLLNLLIMQAVLRREAVVILDPKSDHNMMDNIHQICRLCGREEDLHFLDLGGAVNTIELNPLGNFRRASEIAERLTSSLSGEGSAAQFKSYAMTATAAAVSLLQLEGSVVTLENIRLITSDHSQFKDRLLAWLAKTVREINTAESAEFLSRVQGRKSGNTSIKAMCSLYEWLCQKGYVRRSGDFYAAADIAAMDSTFYSKVTASLKPALNLLTAADLKDLLSASQQAETLSDIISRGGVFYLSLSCLSDSTLGSQLGKLVMADLRALAGAVNSAHNQSIGRRMQEAAGEGQPAAAAEPPQEKPRRVNVFIDEASEIIDQSTIQLLNKGRSSCFALTLATQSYADLASRLGESGAQQVLANCNTVISLRIFDQDSAVEIASSFPQVPVEEFSSSLNYQEDITEGTLNFGGSQGLNCRSSSLIPPALLSNLPNFAYVARLADGRIVQGEVPIVLSCLRKS